jgi:signal transduction histidine kinase/ActR/RegA family two-component response regulator
MPADPAMADLRVLLLAPTPRDGEASCRLLGLAGIQCDLCESLEQLCAMVPTAAAIIVPEEVVLADQYDQLSQAIHRQPVWSDLPVIVLSRTGAESPAVERALATLGNVSLIERPVRVSTLISVVRAAIRARIRQYQARDYFQEQRRAEQAVRDAKDAAEAANKSKDQFLAVLSHELRTPLSPVVMAVAAMQKDPELPARLGEDLAMVRRNIELETKLIDDLLDVSRVTSGKLRLRLECVSIHDLLKHVLEVCASDISAKRLDVSCDTMAPNDRVEGDAARLQQVFWNLLKNAIKFTPKGQRISIATASAGDARLRVEITDTGVGIPADVLPRLFNAFEQGSPSITRQFGGLGLGLAISKAVVDLHGGSIEARSAGLGRGASFTVELPTTTHISSDNHPPVSRAGSNGHHLPRILLVEDHADTARMLARLLSSSGHSVETAASVASALELAEKHPFDVIISDIGLPDASGYELMEQISRRHGIRGIALSGYGMERDMQRSRDAGFSEHLVKPINLEQLEAVIRRVAGAAALAPM